MIHLIVPCVQPDTQNSANAPLQRHLLTASPGLRSAVCTESERDHASDRGALRGGYQTVLYGLCDGDGEVRCPGGTLQPYDSRAEYHLRAGSSSSSSTLLPPSRCSLPHQKKVTADEIARRMVDAGHQVTSLHGSKEADARDQTIDDFRNGKSKVRCPKEPINFKHILILR